MENHTTEELTILLCDVRNLMGLFEADTAPEAFQSLNRLFAQINQILTQQHGSIHKSSGERILVTFKRRKFHAVDAIKAAIQMRYSLQEFSQNYPDFPPDTITGIGMGIHTGWRARSILFFEDRLNSLAIDNLVHTASRIESLIEFYGCIALASETTIAHIRSHQSSLEWQEPSNQFLYRWVDSLAPRGKQKGIELYEILGSQAYPIEAGKVRSRSIFQRGIEAWQQRNPSLALNYFQQAIAQTPEDTIAKLYIKRCQNILTSLAPQSTG
ncbi:adenylate/guanylate cyclase domain-containing protein [Oscillatoria amoena NRMC-F 0135]|nr:adenylate/guanylate cyclase domain-containing protein [Geitlerinema splendidum]MDL5050457.1 adenylate/guanylate cyclase domain-containing protein [Oscillatoria amoena NRMC-F 0135]